MGKATFVEVNYVKEKRRESAGQAELAAGSVSNLERSKKAALVDKARGKRPESADPSGVAGEAKEAEGAAPTLVLDPAARKRARVVETPIERALKKPRVGDARDGTAAADVVGEAAPTHAEGAPLGPFDFSFSYRGAGSHLVNSPRSCARLMSAIAPNDKCAVPDPDDMIEKDAYLDWAGTMVQAIATGNNIATMYDRKLNKARDKIVQQREKIERLQASSDEVSRIAEDLRQKKREAEDRLAEVEVEMGVVKRSAREEMERLKASVADEVAKAEAALRARQQERLDKLKQHCEDMKEVNRITSLANQSGGIKAYLDELNELGTAISMVRRQSLADDKAKYIAELEELEIAEVSDADFQTTPPRDAYQAAILPSQSVAEVTSGSTGSDEGEDEEVEEGEVRDFATGDALMPLDGNPVIPGTRP